MRRSIVAIHVVALAVWLGSLAFSFQVAGRLFGGARKPVCPACLKTTTETETLVVCVGCGALQHQACAKARNGLCSLEHLGLRECVPPDENVLGKLRKIVTPSLTGTSSWTRVRRTGEDVPPERRLLWRLDACTPALSEKKDEGESKSRFVPGACFELPYPAVGDSLARVFEGSQVLGIILGVIGLGTAFLTRPGGAMRLMRAGALALALGLNAWLLFSLSPDIAAKRLALDAPGAPTAEEKAAFGKLHGMSLGGSVGVALLVLTALTLASVRREDVVSSETATA
ncbi:hypothetical protein HY251_08520 [bacterium]|nr:hypothetical protein [bacterium]